MATNYVPKSVWALARRDHGVVSDDELVERGYTRSAIRHRVRTGRLHPKGPGVYAVGSPNLTRYGRWMVAIKGCGTGAVLSFLSAAVLWGIWKKEPAEIDVTVPRRRRPRREGVSLSRRDLPEHDVTTRHGLPVTTIVRTLIDLAAVLTSEQLEDLVAEADARGLIGLDVLRHRIEGRSERGAAVLRELLDRHALVLPASRLERLFLPLAEEAGLPKPQMQTQLGSSRVDFYWPELKLVVECDSLRYHRTQLQQAEDHARNHAHVIAERICLRPTHHQIAREPGYVVRLLAKVSAGAARTAGSGSSR
jgi:very-short-patch-repair endonuclease